jgi:hypothetical protein
MALSEFEVARVKKALDSFMQTRRPPPHIRQKLDLGYRISGQSVEIFEIRPAWRGLPHERHESAVAKATFVRSRNLRHVFWQRRDLKWHGYEPASEVRSIDHFSGARCRRPARLFLWVIGSNGQCPLWPGNRTSFPRHRSGWRV